MAQSLATMTEEQIQQAIEHAQSAYNDANNITFRGLPDTKDAILVHLNSYLQELRIELSKRRDIMMSITVNAEAWKYWQLLAAHEGVDPAKYLQDTVNSVDWLQDEFNKVC